LATLFSIYNNYTSTDNTYYKAYLVEVVEVVVLDAVLYIHIGYQLELHVYLVGVFIEGPLEVVGIYYTRLKLRVALYKAICLLLANRLYIMRYKEGIRYIFNTINLGWKSLYI